MKFTQVIITAAVASLLSACGSTQKAEAPTPSSNIPQWVLNPVVEDGIAAADCVKSSGNFSVDQKLAASNTRVALAQQISAKVQALEKNYQERIDSNEESTTGTTFTSVAKVLTDQTLTGSRVVKSDIVSIQGKDHYCSLMTLSPTSTKELFDALITQSKRRVNPQDEKFLYQEFKAAQAQEELDKTMSRLTN
jgi:FlaG/FlaF family flagellin (archaellin)